MPGLGSGGPLHLCTRAKKELLLIKHFVMVKWTL